MHITHENGKRINPLGEIKITLNQTMKNDVSVLTINPMRDFPKIFQNSRKITIKPSFNTINNLIKGGEYYIDLYFESINDGAQTAKCPLTIKPNNSNGINFEINFPTHFICKGAKHKEGYGLGVPLKIYNENSLFYIEKEGIANFETTFPHKPLLLRGSFMRIKSYDKLVLPTYFRCIIPTNDKNMIFPGYILDCNQKQILFDIESLSLDYNNIMGVPMPTSKGHYCELNIKGYNILFYGVQIENNSCLIIDSLDKIHSDEFEEIVYAIRLVYSFFTGCFYNEGKIILNSGDSQFGNIEGISYQEEEKSTIINYQIIDFELFYQLINSREIPDVKEDYNKFRKHISIDIFTFLCSKTLAENSFKRALELITSAGGYNNPVIQGALYSVSLETLAQIICDENTNSVTPMNKIRFKEMRKELLNVFSKYEAEMDDRGVNIIKAKINNINSPTNRDKLEKPFELVGISLTDTEKLTIESRNQYLHGQKPKNSYEWFLASQLNALNILDLTMRLILKYANYKGHYFSPQFRFILQNEAAKEVITKELDISEYFKILDGLKNNKFTELNKIQEAKTFIEEFVPYISVLGILEKPITII